MFHLIPWSSVGGLDAKKNRILTLSITFLLLGCESDVVMSKSLPDDEHIAHLLSGYLFITGELPTTEQGLAALVTRPDDLPDDKQWVQMSRRIPPDAWGNDYEYESLHKDGKNIMKLRSLGQDGIRSHDDEVSTFVISRENIQKMN